MGGDYTRFTHNPEKDYSAVLKQQGRVDLDADWNEAQEISDRHWRAETIDIIGRCAVPSSTPDAFRIQADGTGSFTISKGRMYVDGLLVECHGLDPKQYDAVLGELSGSQNLPNTKQPYYPKPTPLSNTTGTTDLIYIDVWQREVTAIEDPHIQEIALAGPDTTTRIQTVWQVKVLANVGDKNCGDDIPEWNDLIKPSAGRLTTSVDITQKNDNPCIIPAQAGYRGLENRLYRVEIHQGGALGTAKFKWSRDNGSIVSAVEKISADRSQITVRRIGRDSVLRFRIGDWVEVLDDYTELNGSTGHLAKVADINEANRILILNPPIPGSFDFPTDATTNVTDPNRHTRVRRWDQSQNVDANGLMDITAGPIDLEDRIQISFSIDPVGGTFKIGDYWVFAARTANAAVEILDKAPPRGILHHYCRLALATQTSDPKKPTISDCRTLYPPAECCTITVRPGEDIQGAINKVIKLGGGCICLAPGIHRINKPLFIDQGKNLILQGKGAVSKLVFAPSQTIADMAMVYVIGKSQNIQIEHLFIHADALEHLILIDEASQELSINDVILINGTLTRSVDLPDRGDCILLGDCCHISVNNSTIVSERGLVQADINLLQATREVLAKLQGKSPSQQIQVNTLRNLHVLANVVYPLDVAIQLEDALSGWIKNNKVQGRSSESADDFQRIESTLELDEFYSELEKKLALLTCPPTNNLQQTSIKKVRHFGLRGCLLEAFEICENYFYCHVGIVISFARAVNFLGNSIIETGEGMTQTVGIAIDYGFDIKIENNVIELAIPQPKTTDTINTISEYLAERFNLESLGIALSKVRGLSINNNQIKASTAIGVLRLSLGRCAVDYSRSLLRLLRIRRAWRVFVELAWFIWQFLLLASQSSSNNPSPNSDQNSRDKFEQQLIQGFVNFLLEPSLLPNFLGKVQIANNQLQVSRFGICFNQILTLGGIQILNNRISGFTQTGILIHPWLSVSFPDLTAQLVYCFLEWVITFLTLLQKALDQLLNGKQPQQPPPNVSQIAAIAVSWFVSFCAKYCDDNTGETPPGEPPKRNPAQKLKDALDDLLEHLDLVWLDDLVNQSYVIDNNTLRGSGDGIWVGIDGTQISNNHITIHPANSVAYESIIFGILLQQRFPNNPLGNVMIELDRDLILFSTIAFEQNPINWTTDLVQQLQKTVADTLILVANSSPLKQPLTKLQEQLALPSPNSGEISKAFLAVLVTILYHLRGYGIAMIGADMKCMQNYVLASNSCNINIRNIANPNRRRDVTNYPAIGGIWHFSNLVSLFIDAYSLLFETAKVSSSFRFLRLLQIIELWIALLLLLSRRERSLNIAANKVESALAHGIRTLNVISLEELEIFDNYVKNAARYGIYYSNILNQKCCVKVHRNTIIRNKETFDFRLNSEF
ncbi:hypothetical protein A6770_22165 [Nostoc minutum NIES-26]|uniref:Uncharacterized protein n=1 Tax=Nostoc minutum NIES-26 TaxID=1844469 RepID=A0A367QZR4_9NOSO|nr:hypothetical protein A6770_22165 [Nostoc minutum NIES-26]